MHRSFTGFAGKLPSSSRLIFKFVPMILTLKYPLFNNAFLNGYLTLNSKMGCISSISRPVPSLRRGAIPPNGCLCPIFGLLKILFLEHHATTKQQPMMEKGIITFKHNSLSTFFRFFAKLLAPLKSFFMLMD